MKTLVQIPAHNWTCPLPGVSCRDGFRWHTPMIVRATQAKPPVERSGTVVGDDPSFD